MTRRAAVLWALLASVTGWADERAWALRQASKASWVGGHVENELALRRAASTAAPSEILPLLRSYAAGDEVHLKTLAGGLLFEQSRRLSLSEEERRGLLKQLRASALTPTVPAWARNEACRALLDGNWVGRDQWYLEQLEVGGLARLQDPKGGQTFSPLLAPIEANPERWIPVLLRKLKSSTSERRVGLAHLLAGYSSNHPRRDIGMAMLPWLRDRNWTNHSDDDCRSDVMWALSKLDLPEAGPAVLGPLKGGFAPEPSLVLIRNPTAEAVPALKEVLARPPGALYMGDDLVQIAALAACGGLPRQLGVDGLVAYARACESVEGKRALKDTFTRLPDPLRTGAALARFSAPETICREVLKKLKLLEPKAAWTLQRAILHWRCPSARGHALALMRSGLRDRALLRALMAGREGFGDHLELRKLAESARGRQAGLAAAVWGKSEPLNKILKSADYEAISGLLDAALASKESSELDSEEMELSTHQHPGKLKVAPALVARLLDGPQAAQAMAYLESENSSKAREILLALPDSRETCVGFVPDTFRDKLRPYEDLFDRERTWDECWAYIGGTDFLIRRQGGDYVLEVSSRRRSLTPSEVQEFLELEDACGLDLKPSIEGVDWHGYGTNYCRLHFQQGRPGIRSYLGSLAWRSQQPEEQLLFFLTRASH